MSDENPIELTHFEDGNVPGYFGEPKGDGKLTYHHATNILSLQASRPSQLIIRLEDRVLLTIRREGDVFTADYDPADLDAAAAQFVEEVNRQLARGVLGESEKP